MKKEKESIDIPDYLTYIEQGKYRKAEAALRRELEHSPQDAYLNTQLANVLWEENKNDAALDYADKAKAVDSDYSFLNFTRGRILLSMDRFKEALSEFDAIVSKEIEQIAEEGWGKRWAESLKNDALLYKAFCYHSLYCDEEAEMLVKKHLACRRKGLGSEYSKKYVVQFLRELSYSPKNPDDRYKDYSEGVMTKKQRDRLFDYLDHFKKRRDKDKIVKYLKRKGRQFPNDYFLWTTLSEYCYDYGMKELCLECAERANALVNNENDMLVLFDYGSALYLNGMYQKAVCVFDKILSKDLDYIAYNEHGEGMRWAKSIVKQTLELKEICQKKLDDDKQHND